MTDKDTIILKIKKLIALGTNNTNENEVAAALAKAAELALRNNLDLERINKSEEAVNEIGKYQIKDEPSASIPGSTRLLWAGVSEIFGCTAILGRELHNGKWGFVLSIVAPRGLRETIIYLGPLGAGRVMLKYKIKVVLTIAHLDHDRTNNDYSNLKALCQRCHLALDKEQHARNARITRARQRREKEINAGQLMLI